MHRVTGRQVPVKPLAGFTWLGMWRHCTAAQGDICMIGRNGSVSWTTHSQQPQQGPRNNETTKIHMDMHQAPVCCTQCCFTNVECSVSRFANLSTRIDWLTSCCFFVSICISLRISSSPACRHMHLSEQHSGPMWDHLSLHCVICSQAQHLMRADADCKECM